MRILLSLFLTLSSHSFAVPTLKLQGSTTVNPVVTEAAEVFRQKGWKIFVDTQGGSSGGISALAEKQINLAMSSKPISDSDRKKYPKSQFVTHSIGMDGIAIVVSKKVFEAGVKALTKVQLKNIYEGKITHWNSVGGNAAPIVFFNKEPGRGTWEVFATYLYGKAELAPAVTHPEVGSNEEARTKVAGHTSGISQLSEAWVSGHESIRALDLILENGQQVSPNRENIFSGKYPLARSLFLVSNGELKGPEREFVEYLKSEEGQKLVVKHGYLPLNVKP